MKCINTQSIQILRGFCVALLVISLFGCSGGSEKPLLSQHWDDIEDSVHGSLVKLYMNGSNPEINKWVDTYVAEEMKTRYGLTLVRVPLDAAVIVAKLVAEKDKGSNVGGVDLFWVNGENFRVAKENDILFGPFAERLPNFIKHVDKRIAAYDFGYPVDGYEVPLGRAQFVFEYDSERFNTPPKSFIDLLDWVRENPGRFTYPAPTDFTGAAFIRQLFYAVAGSPTNFELGWNEELYSKIAPRVWEYLKEMKPYLWHAGIDYPKTLAELDNLFASGEVDFSMAYMPRHTQAKVDQGAFPAQTKSYLLDLGTLFNMHYLAIPATSSNRAGAMVVANFLLSPDAQLSKFKPGNWGDYPALDLNTLNKEQWDAFAAVKLGPATLSPETLAKHGLPEISTEYVEALKRDWAIHIQ